MNEVMNKAMDNLLDKRANTDQFNRMYYNGEQTDKTLNMVEKIEEIVARQVEAISNLKIDKITVWDSAGSGNGEGSTANFVSSLIHSLPPVHDVAKMAGVDLPNYLGSMKEE